MSVREEVSHLISLTKSYLSLEFNKEDWVFTNPETFEKYKLMLKKKTEESNIPSPPFQARKPLPSKPASKANPSFQKPSQEDIKKEAPKSTTVAPLESLQNLPPLDPFVELRKIIGKHFPEQTLLETPPAEMRPQAFKTPEALIVYSHETGLHLSFLVNLAKAMQLCFRNTLAIQISDKNLESHLKSGTIKLLIGEENILPSFSAKHPEIPTLILPPISSFFENPERKALLWNQILNYG